MTNIAFRGSQRPEAGPWLTRWWATVDHSALLMILLLFAVGLLLSSVATPPLAEDNNKPQFHYLGRQTIFGCAALCAMLMVSLFDPKRLRRISILGFGVAFIAICLLPIFGKSFGMGATRWFAFGGFTVQPVEFLKPFLTVLLAWMLASARSKNGPPGVMFSIVTLVVVLGVIALQPDFAQSVLIGLTWASMFYLSGGSNLILIALMPVAGGCGWLIYETVPYFATRVDDYLSPEVEATSQLGKALHAMQEGGLFGSGVGEGSIKWNLADAHTDFILAVAIEEFGGLISLILVGLFMAIVLRVFLRVMSERDTFIRLAAGGLAVQFGLQALINMGATLGMVPTTGMTLPFVSYGGSSMLAVGLTLGMILALTRTRPGEDLGDMLSYGRD